ncbi:bifunctional dihydroorotate dehydrogenase B NAD binding subunit/NADPH-dependent glutamate synthase [Fusobacterium varium]|uniref:bifunctional dihydroorotate dehydrogenase B NAD binding subunit/NADPH-dependent glutamate synthase n=1 Tax=Fusobacterium varium TaxID=856 RepID=UPI000E408F06|nr:bifunctional dihydroorotate dehydrogenase B NAD binding subunit/NADPH-dependent glutamate synthase [Fusobacterium varium]MCF0169352.1 bifunctional dihydroorotate dehydrogenase B NAD binding subunit/NADPH-dependent glutamate synthase [Fusobacterium varium]MCF2673678.1 bifunctional dihydroorotate dehydrogenase B NAD binding subunit/NADPH-dependent glutamate synthase [Fusobacterium varium]RGJ27937.1 bifunctional dihydroorotate dehydrogenase B NAD binding subunit/NADPH-dependent glutamate synthas
MYKIVEKKWLTPIICYMDIEAPDLAASAQPGQFLIIRTDDKGERIPLTICDYDRKKGTVTIVFQVLGESTRKMGEFKEGEYFADVTGPLGQPSELIHIDIENLKKKNYLFVAGGVGTAPVYPQVKWLKENGIDVDVIIGTRSRDTLIFEDEMKAVSGNLFVCTDDGTYGRKGMVTDVIDDLLKEGKHYDHAVIIGPMIMMKFASKKCRENNIPNTVSLNPLMVDGTGMCGACRVTIDGKVKFACVDGPEFDGDQVNFDEAMRRQTMYKTEEGRNILMIEDGETHHNPACPNHEIIVDKKKRVPVREQEPDVRNKNFEEVCYGYNLEEAQAEAARCLNCKNPLCVQGCPVSIDIPAFIQKIKEGDMKEAGKIIARYSNLPAVCGRVCPQETQCEGKCILGIKGEAVSIGKLERFVGDWVIENGIEFEIKEKNNKKVAVIGGGPAGLTAAGDLAKMGYDVTIYEALHKLGGVLSYGIPEFRLPKEKVVDKEIENLYKLGVKVVTNAIVGRTFTIDELLDKKGYSAVFIGSGAGLPRFMNIPGENYNGVISANEFLTRVNLMRANKSDYATPIKIGKRVIVVGGGNVAMDAARTAKRLGAETTVVYRRGEAELPARREEVEHAKEEGIKFHFLVSPTEIIGDEKGWVKEIKCIRMELGEPDESGRAKFSPIENSEFIIEGETVIMSLGTSPNPLIASTTENLKINRWKGIEADEETGRTSREGVFAGGDAVTGAATVILAMEAGKKAAVEIDNYLKNK